MELQFSGYALVALIAAILAAVVAIVAWRRRPSPGAMTLGAMMAFVAIWSLGYAFRLLSTDLAGKLFWAKFRYLGIVWVPATWLIFAVRYTGYGKKWLTSWAYALLSIEPAVVLVLVWTNEVHQWFWAQTELVSYGSLTLLSTAHGPAFWFHTIYSYLLVIGGSALLALMLVRAPAFYRRQALSLLLALLSPLVGSVLSIFHLFPAPLDLVPFGFVVAGAVLVWGLFRSHLLEVAPVPQEAIVEALPIATLVLDDRGRITDLNPEAERLLGLSVLEVAGKSAERVLSRHPELLRLLRTEEGTEVILGGRTFAAQATVLRDQAGEVVGRLITLQETTERKRAEEMLRQELRRIRAVAEVARISAATEEISELLERSVRLLHDRLGFEHVAAYVVDDRQAHVILAVAAGEGGGELSPGHRWRVEEAGAVGRAIRTRRLQWLSDVEGEAKAGPHLEGGRSEVAIPLQAGARVLGVLDVQSRTPAAFSENDVATLQAIADQVATAMKHLRRVREAEQAAYGLEATADLTPRLLWESAFREISRPIGYRFRGVSVEPVGETYPEAVRACREGRPITFSITAEGNGREGMGVLAVPIRLRDRVIGVVNLRFEGEAVPPEVVSLVEAVSDRLALALENARLMEETQRRAAHERLRAEVSARIRASADIDAILRTAVRELSRALQASEGLIRLEVGDGGRASISGEEEQR
ncbi:MAG TPA: GAF domain-containing protein [Chloroflexi bacterium]|nr:GAF domain-containing protein [Chloroflexota bacterium]